MFGEADHEDQQIIENRDDALEAEDFPMSEESAYVGYVEEDQPVKAVDPLE